MTEKRGKKNLPSFVSSEELKTAKNLLRLYSANLIIRKFIELLVTHFDASKSLFDCPDTGHKFELPDTQKPYHVVKTLRGGGFPPPFAKPI